MASSVESSENRLQESIPDPISHKSEENKSNEKDKAALRTKFLNFRRQFKHHGMKEWLIAKHYWAWLLLFILLTLVHSVWTKLAFYLYNLYGVQWFPVLPDLGFKALGEWDYSYRPIADALTFILLGGAVIYGFAPFFVKCDYYGMQVLTRFLASSSLSVTIRSVSFLLTILPSPAPHCRGSSPDYNPPTNAFEIVFGVNVVNGCADLIWSSHITYAMTVTMCYWKYGNNKFIKAGFLALTLANALCAVGFENHYSVDVWLALVINPFLFLTLNAYWPDTKPQKLIDMEKEDAEAEKLEAKPEDGSDDVRVELESEPLQG